MTRTTLDLTDRVERMEAVEERLGISIEALYVKYIDHGPGGEEFRVLWVNFDVVSPNGALKQDVEIVVSSYNDARQLEGTSKQVIKAKKFFGLESCSIAIDDNSGPPSRIRIFPKPW